MSPVTRPLPCYNGPVLPPVMLNFTGFEVGSFFVHRGPPDKAIPKGRRLRGDWTVTHSGTGYSIKKLIPSKQRALWLAKQLEDVCDWGFTDPAHAKSLPKEVKGRIGVLLVDAMNGDCQGSQP